MVEIGTDIHSTTIIRIWVSSSTGSLNPFNICLSVMLSDEVGSCITPVYIEILNLMIFELGVDFALYKLVI